MLCSVVTLVLLAGSYEVAARARATEGCTVSVNKGLPSPQPLLLAPAGSKDGFGFELPVPPNDIISFKAGESVKLACPGTSNYLVALGTGKVDVTATCVSGTTFLISGVKHEFSQLACKSLPSHTARKTGQKCLDGKYEEIELGFLVDSAFYRLIDVCFDSALGNTLYSRFDLVKNIGGSQNSYPRPSTWDGAAFYPGYNPNSRYVRHQQISTIAGILGSQELASKYVSTTSDMYLARGHLTAKADFVFGAEQWVTFNYVNTAPQWQSFNEGNWEKIEYSTRRLAKTRTSNLVVYTGTHGVATLPASDGKDKELYLYVQGSSRGMPVPKFFWKVVYDSTSQKGVALLGVNSPYIKSPFAEYIICPDVSEKLSWLTWTRTNVTAGYSYACEVAAFRKVVDTLPNFTVKSLLT